MNFLIMKGKDVALHKDFFILRNAVFLLRKGLSALFEGLPGRRFENRPQRHPAGQ